MALNLLISIPFFLLFVVNPFHFVEPRTLEVSEHPFTRTLRKLKEINKGQRVRGVGELKSYLKKFGYLTTNDNSSNNNHFDKNVEFALKEYQVFHHLRPTGRVDAETIKRMGLPRCGVPDIITPQNHKLKGLVILANYSFFSGSPKWEESKRALTYTFVSSANVLRMYDVRLATRNAFQSWARASNFTFMEMPSEYNNLANIVLGFHRGDHGDGYPFDGPGQVLAHTFAPQDGRLHFDADEPWSIESTNWNVGPGWNVGWDWRRWVRPRWQSRRTIDLQTVALHEIGHLLGLGHSNVPGSIMYPSYEGVKRDLTQDDVDGIRALYRLPN
ncbi:hypothetical protein JHK87_052059 [Glycine soja]|nr:hypothetical protein JHK87_052059 [Glycine soja]